MIKIIQIIKLKKYNFISDNIIEVDDLDGFSMLVNKNNFDDSDYFDENFFLYLENNDLCLRVKKIIKKFMLLKILLSNIGVELRQILTFLK